MKLSSGNHMWLPEESLTFSGLLLFDKLLFDRAEYYSHLVLTKQIYKQSPKASPYAFFPP